MLVFLSKATKHYNDTNVHVCDMSAITRYLSAQEAHLRAEHLKTATQNYQDRAEAKSSQSPGSMQEEAGLEMLHRQYLYCLWPVSNRKNFRKDSRLCLQSNLRLYSRHAAGARQPIRRALMGNWPWRLEGLRLGRCLNLL